MPESLADEVTGIQTSPRKAQDLAAGQVQQLLGGLNETVNWHQFARGPHREQTWARVRDLRTAVIRLVVFDKGAPDPVNDWETFAACVQAVVSTGAVPMITFAKFSPPYDDPVAVRAFADRCAQVVAGCVHHWGEAVGTWYWCVWHHPNSEWVSAGLTFEHYRRIYEEVAQCLVKCLPAASAGRRPLLGGPAVDGFQPFWSDWVWRFVNEIDNALIGFASWHQFGDWREPGAWGAPADEAVFRQLLLARVAEYETRARAVGRMLKGRGILNVCGELNTHAHHEPSVSSRYNQTAFGAAYCAAALIRLLRGGADLALWKSGTDAGGPYGILDGNAVPNPVFHAQRLWADHVRPGDRVWFPKMYTGNVDVVTAHGAEGRKSTFVVHRSDTAASYAVSALTGCQMEYTLLLLDHSTRGQVTCKPGADTLRFEGYGVAVLTHTAGG